MRLVELGGRGVLVGAALIAVLCVAPSADAGKPPISIGRISTRVPKRADVRRELESAVQRELGRIDWSGVRGKQRYVLSASLTKMETVTEGGQSESTCVVSATLTREGGALHAVLQGRARAVDRRAAARDAELGALRAAVRSAIGRVPEALR